MNKKPKKNKIIVYWDSNIFVKWFNQEDLWEQVEFGLEKAKQDELLIVTSALTLAEVVKLRNHARIPTKKRAELEQLFDEPYIEKIGITPITGKLARNLVWDYNIDPKDAVHVAAAFERKVPNFHTYDVDLRNRATNASRNLEIKVVFQELMDAFPEKDCVQRKLEFDEQPKADADGRVQPSAEAIVEPKAEKPKRRVTTV